MFDEFSLDFLSVVLLGYHCRSRFMTNGSVCYSIISDVIITGDGKMILTIVQLINYN